MLSRRTTFAALIAALILLVIAVPLTPRIFGGGTDPQEESRPDMSAYDRNDRWSPEPGTQWQWQLAGTPALEPDIDVYGMDGQETTDVEVQNFTDRGLRTICYLSAGTLENWRPDADRFPDTVVGKQMDDWDGESWLDVRQLDILLPIMAARIDDCARKGFDAVEADNVDGYANDTGFPVSAQDQLRYNRALAKLAHERGLSIALKNNVEQIPQLEPHFDFAINEECFRYDECDAYAPFTAAGKAVLNVEYEEVPGRCERARKLGLSSMLKNMELDAWRQPC